MGEEEVGVGAREDDYFWIAGGVGAIGVGVCGEAVEEGGEVGGEFVVPEVYGGVVDCCADYVGGQVGRG